MTVQDRLRLLRGAESYQQFADRVKANPNSVRRYELGLSRVPLDYVGGVCAAFHVSCDWLVFGVEAKAESLVRAPRNGNNGARQGERVRFLTSAKGDGKKEIGKRYTYIDGEKVRVVCVPVLTRVPAGPPHEMLDTTPVGFGLEGEVWVRDPHDENAYALTAWGDSMEPLIFDGERIVVSPRRRYDFRAGVAVVRIPGGEVCVKYVRVRARLAEVISTNPRYPRMSLPWEEVEVLGQVVQVVARERREN